MATQAGREAQNVVNRLVDIQLRARRIRRDSTVRGRADLLAEVDAIFAAARDGSASACVALFPGDTLSDLTPPSGAA